MNRLALFLSTILLFFFGFAFAEGGFLKLTDVISKKGKLQITDGSSIYIFTKDGKFELRPIGISGRKITGTWKLEGGDDSLIEVEGQWSWINGLSPLDDFRRMVLGISALTGEKEKVGFPSPIEVYKCYFEIEEITKITGKKAAQEKADPR